MTAEGGSKMVLDRKGWDKGELDLPPAGVGGSEGAVVTGDAIEQRRADWRFDAQVAGTFDDHVRKSVPLYAEVQRAVLELSDYFVERGSCVVDVGCASGTTLAALASRHLGKGVTWVGIDEAAPMLEAARAKLAFIPNARLTCASLPSRDKLIADASFVAALYTLQFVRQRDREDFCAQVREGLHGGGAFVLVEKVLGSHPRTEDVYAELQQAFKCANGFSAEEVYGKQQALRGVLVPDSAAEHEERLRRVGFRIVDRFFGWMNWAGWVAVR